MEDIPKHLCIHKCGCYKGKVYDRTDALFKGLADFINLLSRPFPEIKTIKCLKVCGCAGDLDRNEALLEIQLKLDQLIEKLDKVPTIDTKTENRFMSQNQLPSFFNQPIVYPPFQQPAYPPFPQVMVNGAVQPFSTSTCSVPPQRKYSGIFRIKSHF